MQLKQYQKDALATLNRFFQEAQLVGPQVAFQTITQEPELQDRLGRFGGNYTDALASRQDIPYVCLRLPTGGGKTILAAHSVRIARDSWIQKDYPLVLWLVPTNTIRSQTTQTLNDTTHPYRQALDESFDGRVRVFDLSDFTHIQPQDIRDNCCIVVGTIQTLRVENTDGRKVYAHNENLETHFSSITTNSPELERLDGGGIRYSLANLMYLHRPLMILDEAHRANTTLTQDMQARLNPSAIVEFTATPRSRSNVLYNVTAQELKQEHMIKLPIMLSEHNSWQSAVSGAIIKRAELAEISRDDDDYIRPIVLFQAQNRNQEVNVETLKNYLINTERIDEDKIAIATGDRRELDGINLFDPHCPIQYIITVEALREGWDCSFAYIFCSVARIRDTRNVEQLFGRVLRMPYASRRRAGQLNKAYAYVSEPTIGAAANALVDTLVNRMGFEEQEAQENVQSEIPGAEWFNVAGDLFSLHDLERPTFTHTVSVDNLTALAEIPDERLTVRRLSDTEAEIAVTGGIDTSLEEAIYAAIPSEEYEPLSERIEAYRAEKSHLFSPAERGEQFCVPRLMSVIQGELEIANTDTFMEYHECSVLRHLARLSEYEFKIENQARIYEIYMDGRRLAYRSPNEQNQLALNIDVDDWTPENLVIWLDRQVHQIDIHQSELLKWLTDLVTHLHNSRGIPITALTHLKYVLAQKISDKISSFRMQERNSAFQRNLIAPEARVEVSFDDAFEFRQGMYNGIPLYQGRWRPSKHFLGADQLPAFDGASNGEEEQCAQILDNLSQVRYWIRNVSRRPNSFWLPTVTDRFYPDFVAQLNDDRLFVVEYKGEHIAESADTREKRTIGELWERHSKGRGLFLVVERVLDSLEMRDQLERKISGS